MVKGKFWRQRHPGINYQMIRFSLFAGSLLACLIGVAPAYSQEGSARAQLERFSEELRTLQASFEQQVISTDGAVQDKSSGEVWLMRPGLFRWEYGGDFPEKVIADGANIWIYDEVLTHDWQPGGSCRHAQVG